ncbi:substrate-binding domain-containing protein [Variovorax sp. Varisp62]|uniref:substrate-binding domain-containing protein n=1 Tax=Variovorax sp. Varisp62 TaxID=3243049 RepID=UPI0039B3C527
MVAQMRQAEEVLARHRDADSPQHLVIGVTPWIGQTLLAHVLPPYRAELPHVQLELFDGLSRLALPLLRDSSLDLMIGRIPPPETMEGLQTKELFTYDVTVVARSDHPRAGVRSIAELLDQDWILNFTPNERAAAMENLFGQHGYEAPRRRIHLAHSVALSMTLVQQTDMLSLCPWPLVETEGRNSGLVLLQLRERFHASHVGVVRRANQALPHAATRFLAHLMEQTNACLASNDPRPKRVFRSVELLAEEQPAS